MPQWSWSATQEPQFTREEVLAVTSFFLPPADADAAVSGIFGVPNAVTAVLPSGTVLERPATWVTFTGDMLILLSFLSPETHAKAEAHRQRIAAVSPNPTEAKAAWDSRRRELWNDPTIRKLCVQHHK
jgi:hypothetical protein